MSPAENPESWTKCPWCEFTNEKPNSVKGHAYKMHPDEMRAASGKPPVLARSAQSQAPVIVNVNPGAAPAAPAKKVEDEEVRLLYPDEAEAEEKSPPPGAFEVPEFTAGSATPSYPIEWTRLQRTLKDIKWDPKMKVSLWNEWINLPPNYQNSQFLFNAFIARGASPYLAGHVVNMVYRPNEMYVHTPQGAFMPYATMPMQGTGQAPNAPVEEDPIEKRRKDLEAQRLQVQEMIQQRTQLSMLRQMEIEGGGSGGPDPTQMFVEGVKFAAESAKQGITGQDLLAALRTGVEVGRPPQAEPSAFKDQLYQLQQDTIRAAHEREIALIQAKSEAEKAAYVQSSPMNAFQQTAGMMKEMQILGLAQRPTDPNVELKGKELDIREKMYHARREDERDQRKFDMELKARKEDQETRTIDRLLETANNAIKTIADPISKGLGDRFRSGEPLFAPQPPGAPPVAVQQPQQLTPEQAAQQMQKLDQVIAGAQEYKRRLQAGQPAQATPPQ